MKASENTSSVQLKIQRHLMVDYLNIAMFSISLLPQ
jgi:hypothetical protein